MVETTVPVSGTKVAELTKLIENTFRHVNIALVNEMAMLARPLGVNIWDAIDAAASKPFGCMRFAPGPGVGGHCLPIVASVEGVLTPLPRYSDDPGLWPQVEEAWRWWNEAGRPSHDRFGYTREPAGAVRVWYIPDGTRWNIPARV